GKIAQRIAELSARREVIVTRRGSGAHGPDDGANLALIQADMEGLTGLLPDAVARVAAAEAAYRGDSAACARCREEISRLEAQAHLGALAAHAEALAAKLLETIGGIAVAERQVGKGGPPSWRAPRELYVELRSLAAKNNEL
ncbi:MAG TPA: hypothetical protein VMV54_06370, partial [Acidocella sp.]|nr:hypothetical protein [Acidocella sp.]